MAFAHSSREEYAEAAALLEQAIRMEGPLDREALISEFVTANRGAVEARAKDSP